MTNLIEAFDPRTSEQLLAANQNTIPNIDSKNRQVKIWISLASAL